MTTYVKYIGLAHARLITADEWRQAGVSDGETTVWDHTNGHAVPADKFGDRAMALIRQDGGFVVVGSDEDLTLPLPHQMTPGQAGSPKVDLLANGQSSTEAPGGDAPITRSTGTGSTSGD